MHFLKKHWLRITTHIACWVPFAVLIWDFLNDNLTVNPIQEATFRTGKTALILLMLALACTPFNTLLGLKQVLPLRRPLGLYAFFYACLHLLSYTGLDQGFSLPEIVSDVAKHKFILLGMATWLLLLPLAITSTQGWQRRLGYRRWKRLHRAVYLAGGMASFHFLLRFKTPRLETVLWMTVIALLLLFRAVDAVRRRVGVIESP
jgi:sulfoxide reductase heme-binding subunit YedZ